MRAIKFIFLAPFIFSLFACSENSSQQTENVTHVETKKIISKDVAEYIKSFGYLKELEDVNVKAQVSGQIQKIHFTEGQNVKKGDLLITINPEMFLTDLKNDMAVFEEDQADLKLKEYIVKKNQNLPSAGAMAEQDFKKLITDVKVAESKIEVDKANILRDKINLQYCYIKAPINGVIGINKIDVGNVISPADILCNIKSTNPLYVDFSVPEKYIYRLKQAIKRGEIKTIISVSRVNEDGKSVIKTAKGKIKFLNNTADPSTGTVSLRSIVSNNHDTVMPGEFVNIKINIGNKKNAILVPQSAVQFGPQGKYLFIAEDNLAKRVDVETGEMTGKYYLLSKGNIKPGNLAIVTGLESLSAGDKIRIENQIQNKHLN